MASSTRIYVSYASLLNAKGGKQIINVDTKKGELAYIYLGSELKDDTLVYEAEETYTYPHCTISMFIHAV